MKRFLIKINRRIPGKKLLVVILLMIVAAGIAADLLIKPLFLKRDKPAAPGKSGSMNIITGIVESREISETIETPGEIVFKEKVNISSRVNGRLARVYSREGQIIKKGELIAEIERLPLEITLKQQKSELDIAKKGFELAEARYCDALKGVEIKLKSIMKAKTELYDKKVSYENMNLILKNKTELFNAGGISQTELEGIKTQHTTLNAKYELAKADYEIQQVGYREHDIAAEGLKVPASEREKLELFKRINTKIERAEVEAARSRVRQAESGLLSTELLIRESYLRSPISGVIAVRNMEAGEMVREDSVIATVIDISRVFISMNLNEKDVHRIRKGQNVRFSADALSGKMFDGVVETITPLLDTKSRTIEVRAAVSNPVRNLLPGMFSRAVINTGNMVKGILIPKTSVMRREDGREEVFVVKNGILIAQNISTGSETGEEILVTEGLAEGDRIVIKGVNLAYQGMKLQ